MSSEPRWAGWCVACRANVWLTPLGGCAAGHDSGSILSPYMATPSAPGPPESPGLTPLTAAKPDHFWRRALLITLGVVVLLAGAAGLLVLVFIGVIDESGQGGDYLGTWVGTTEDGTVITLTVESAGTGSVSCA